MHLGPRTDEQRPNRRSFLGTAAASVFAAPHIVQSTARGAEAPSERINVAFIGTGNQAMHVVMPQFLKRGDVQVVAVCDVNKASYGYKGEKDFFGREPAQQRVNTHYAKASRSGTYRRLIPDSSSGSRAVRSWFATSTAISSCSSKMSEMVRS